MKKIMSMMMILSSVALAKTMVIAPAGLPALSLTEMINTNQNYDYKIEKNADALVVDMLKRSGDIAIVPSNFAATLYNKNLNYKILGTIGWGSFYMISPNSMQDIHDLKDQTIYTIGKGLTPDIILQNVLIKNGLKINKDVFIKYVGNAGELAGFYMSGKAKIIVVPEPVLTKILSKKPTTCVNFKMNELWKDITGFGYPQSTLIVKTEVLKNNPKEVQNFVKDINSSINFLYSNDENRNKYVQKLNLKIDVKDLDKILKRANFNFLNAKDSQKIYDNYYEILYKNNPKVIGGKLPNEEIYADFK